MGEKEYIDSDEEGERNVLQDFQEILNPKKSKAIPSKLKKKYPQQQQQNFQQQNVYKEFKDILLPQSVKPTRPPKAMPSVNVYIKPVVRPLAFQV